MPRDSPDLCWAGRGRRSRAVEVGTQRGLEGRELPTRREAGRAGLGRFTWRLYLNNKLGKQRGLQPRDGGTVPDTPLELSAQGGTEKGRAVSE